MFLIYCDKLWCGDIVLAKASWIITGFKADVNLGKSQITKTRVGRLGEGPVAPASGSLPRSWSSGELCVVAGKRLYFP